MRQFCLILLLAGMGVLLSAPPGRADVQEFIDYRFDMHKFSGLGGFQFLKIGQGARPVAMGDAYMAVADDINAIFWNPAGLTEIRRLAWTATYTKWLVDSYVFSGGVAWNTRTALGGVIGMSVVGFQPGEIEETTIFQPLGTGQNVSSGDIGISAVYALRLTDKFSFGARISWLHQTLYTFSLNQVSIDVGTHFHTGFKSLRLGMGLRNFGPDKRVLSSTFLMPLQYNVALAAEVFGQKGDPTYLTVSGETLYATDYDLRALVGAELWVQNMLALRGGYKFAYQTDSYSLGVGLKKEIAGDRALTVDVAYSKMEWFTAPIRVTIGGVF